MFETFRFSEIRPRGWLKKQLEIQASGLSGNLDRVWPDVRDSMWFGGQREGWERAPYWLDGFIPLAYLLDDDELKARADRYIGMILDRQERDGWICPCAENERAGYDLWAYILVCKVLALYAENTDNARAKDGLYRALKCLYTLLDAGEIKLEDWGHDRWFELLIPLLYMRSVQNEPWLTKLGEIARAQGRRYLDFEDTWKTPVTRWTKHTHIVNLTMALKYEALCAAFFGEEVKGEAERMWKILDLYNGTAVGTFTGDECLSGIGNNRGTELCAVTELMYSCETVYRLTGDRRWLMRLEKAAFNALPATLSDDMWTHQYVQSVNQIACVRFPGFSFFRTNSGEAHLFGLEPNYGCCTANFNQGWPKLAMNVFLSDGKNIRIASPLPAELETEIDGAGVRVKIESDYPFRHSFKIRAECDGRAEFSLSLAVPSWVKKLTVDGEERPLSSLLSFRCGEGARDIEVAYFAEPRFVLRPHDLYAAEYGPLVFSLPLKAEYKKLEYTRNGVERKYPYCDYELTSPDEWRYGFADVCLRVAEREGDGIPFSSQSPSLVLETKLARVAWEHANGYETVANETPASDKALCESETKVLYPYGCAKLRMTEMPFTK